MAVLLLESWRDVNKKREHKEKEGEVKSKKKREVKKEETEKSRSTVALSISKAKHERGNLGASLLTYAATFICTMLYFIV